MSISQQNITSAQKFLAQGVEKKRKGDYKGAIQAYLKSIELNPADTIAYYSLAKTLYLTKNRKASVIYYLTSMHMSTNYQRQALKLGNVVVTMERQALANSMPANVLADIRTIHPDADLIFLDFNTPLHLAHAVIDLQESLPKSKAVQHDIVEYRKGLEGKANYRVNEALKEIYLSVGRAFVLENLLWEHLDRIDVLELYKNHRLSNRLASQFWKD